MDIHKPKAAHSVREFLTEIGTITIGILIALSLEAAVERWHDRELVEHAKADLRRELAENRASLARVVAAQPRVIASLGRMAEQARLQAEGKTPPPIGVRFDQTYSTMDTAAWESAVATQAVSHMSAADARALASAYSGSRDYNSLEEEARKPFFELTSLDPRGMTLAQMRDLQRVITLNRGYETSRLALGRDILTIYNRALARLGP